MSGAGGPTSPEEPVLPPTPACPRCAGPVAGGAAERDCATHGPVPPLWRPEVASYDGLVAQLRAAASSTQDVPTYLPWPVGPGWAVTDLGTVGEPGAVQATMTGVSGATELDGAVDLLVVVEEPGTGLGAARAGLPHGVTGGPPVELFDEPPQTRIRAGGLDVRLWAVPLPEDRETSAVPDSPGALFDPLADVGLDRSVLVGEASGRWLWLLVRPASALLLLGADLALAHAAELGPALVEVSFTGPPPRW